MKNYFSKLREGKNLITVSKFLLIAVLLLGSHFAFACATPIDDGHGHYKGCAIWSCGSPSNCSKGPGSTGFCKTNPQDASDNSDEGRHVGSHTKDSSEITQEQCANALPINATNISINEDIISPVAQISASTSDANSYFFKTLPFSGLGSVINGQTLVHTPIPVNDPIIWGNQNPTIDINNDLPVNINQYDKIPSLFSFILSNTSKVFWPPVGIFSAPELWNNTGMNTFKTAPSSFWSNLVSTPKWYPISLFTMDNPASMLPTVPVKINWKKPIEAPSAVAYHFNIKVKSNPLGLDTNISSDPNANASGDEIDVPVLNATTYTFQGRAMVSYSWSAQPLDSSGNVILGPVAIQSSGSGFWVRQPSVGDTVCQTIAGRIYFTDKYGFTSGDCNPSPAPNTFVYNGVPTGGFRHGREFIEFEPTFSGFLPSKFEIQYAFRPIPDNTPFTDGTIFNYTDPNQTGNPISIPVKTHVITNISASNSNDLSPNRGGFQYDFGLSSFNSSNTGSTHTAANFLSTIANNSTIGVVGAISTAGVNIDGSDSGIYWRVRGLDSSNVPIRKLIYAKGEVYVQPPKVPFESFWPTWTKSNPSNTSTIVGRTKTPTIGYLIDVVKNTDDFIKLPNLDGVASNTLDRVDSTIENNAFLRRLIVREQSFDSGKIAVNKFKEIINDTRKSFVAVDLSIGTYDELEQLAPFSDSNISFNGISTWVDFFFHDLEVFNNNPYDSGIDSYYPKMTNILGLNILPSTAPNKLKFSTTVPVLVVNSGTASMGILQNSTKTETTLTFGASSGYYAFKIIEKKESGIVHPIVFDIGSVPALGNLTNKATAEIDKLLPATTYFWRTRCFYDPDPLSQNSGATKIIFCPSWSTVNSFTTKIDMPSLITVSPTTLATAMSDLPTGTKLTKIESANLARSIVGSFDETESKTKLKGPIKPLDLSKVKPTATQQMKIDPAQLKARVSATQALRKAYEGILNARNSKDGAMLKTAETNFKNAINNLLRQGGSKNLSAAAGLSIDSSLLNTMASKITIAIIILFLIIAIAKMYSNWKLKRKEKENSDTVNM